MKNNFFYQKSLANIHAKPNTNSEVISQILYGESFKILGKKKEWIKIKTNYDNYIGYIKYLNFPKIFKPSFKIYKQKAKIFQKIKGKFKPTKNFLYFATKIPFKNSNNSFIEFDKNRWIKKKDVKKEDYYERNSNKIFKLFLNSKYLWGGKTANGIDCSALVQLYFYFNNVFFPRDTKDQIKFIKKTKNPKLYIKDKLLYWKGHVAICLNKSLLIHAYGPKKKVVIMRINKTIKEIKKNAKLNLKKI